MSRRKRKKTLACRMARTVRGTPKEATVMAPQQEQIRIPQGLTLQRRQVCSPRADERPTLRTSDGHVLAVVEAWMPEPN